MTIRDAYKEGREELKLAGIPDAGLDAWYLMEYATGIGRAAYYANPDRELAKKDREKYRACLEKAYYRGAGIYGVVVFCKQACAHPKTGYRDPCGGSSEAG